MSEIRTDPLTGFTTIFAPERARRPIKILEDASQYVATQEQIDSDPFAEGKEAETTPELFAIRSSATTANQPGWNVRVVANKYPALSPVSGSDHYGVHEVIVECPEFETRVSRLNQRQFQYIFQAYRQRVAAHRDDPHTHYALIFKNQGILGGASLGHVHSQLLVSHLIPQALQQELQAARTHQSEQGCSLFKTFTRDSTDGFSGRVMSTEYFDIICPYASRFAYETWVIPRSLKTHFDHSSDQELDDLSCITRRLLCSLESLLGRHDLNYVIQMPPYETSEQDGYAWSLRIYPRLAHLAGFEIASNAFINPVYPEQAIEQLRRQLSP
ncbi:galactose-1-phosphate uridylyltransferase [Gimesia algae]|uniref:Galactose-1-phosphate uridylyltransferase n=1 Tax=Gimesia algae TaxID=2527971 RepID=A0A517VIB2_9PLAN|nr:hypothetical protein [Gimesia algae]QDT92738.1 Galactose-1-phosphate uridylyltransferase [Gimesia algae]